MGLVQGFSHCAAMCGPFVLAFGVTSRSAAAAGEAAPTRRPSPLALIAAHQAGRVAVFTLLGLGAGAIGQAVDVAGHVTGLDAAAGILGGALMLAWAVDQLRTGHGAGALERWSLLRLSPVQALFRRVVRVRTPGAALGAGAIVGLHPCGLIFAMLASAAATGSPRAGAVMLLAFGLGTAPALSAIAAAGWYGGARLRSRPLAYAAGVLAAVAGVLFVLRGLAANGAVPEVNPWLF
ncbi:MAG: sulfite exporter TauE/SafE family protein [Firmicutes bacterium]|nr:sulfite exporter TauE/SafE family protein [Bacillota bacterium]